MTDGLQLLKQEGVKLLSAIEHDEHSLQGDVPSWTVDWRMDIVQNSLGYYPDFEFFRASSEGVGGSDLQIEGSMISLSGGFFGGVAHVHRFSEQEADWDVDHAAEAIKKSKGLNTVLDNIFGLIDQKSTPCAYAPERKTDALSLTLCTGLTNYERAEKDIEVHRNMFKAFCKVRESILDSTNEATSAGEENSLADSFWYDMSLGCKGRSFFTTTQGYYGLGPWVMQPEDQCWLIKGAKVPFILRKAEDGSSYRLLGEAYIHGIMEGEFVRDRGDQVDWQKLWIV